MSKPTDFKKGDRVQAQEPFFRKKWRNRMKRWAVRGIVEDETHGTLLECVEWYRRNVKITRVVFFKPVELSHPRQSRPMSPNELTKA